MGTLYCKPGEETVLKLPNGQMVVGELIRIDRDPPKTRSGFYGMEHVVDTELRVGLVFRGSVRQFDLKIDRCCFNCAAASGSVGCDVHGKRKPELECPQWDAELPF